MEGAGVNQIALAINPVRSNPAETYLCNRLDGTGVILEWGRAVGSNLLPPWGFAKRGVVVNPPRLSGNNPGTL